MMEQDKPCLWQGFSLRRAVARDRWCQPDIRMICLSGTSVRAGNSVRAKNSVWAGRSGHATELAVGILIKQVGQLANNGAAKLVDIGDRHRPAVITGDIMANADGQKLYR